MWSDPACQRKYTGKWATSWTCYILIWGDKTKGGGEKGKERGGKKGKEEEENDKQFIYIKLYKKQIKLCK